MGKTLTHSFGSAKRDLCTVLNIIVDISVPLRGTMGMECYVQRTHSGAASQLAVGFRKYGPASRNPQLMVWFGEWYKVTYYGEII